MKIDDFKSEKWIQNYGVRSGNPGWLYILQNGSRFKIGKTINFQKRIKEARTWIPEIQTVGVKPFWHASHIEQTLHIALSDYWVGLEWFDFDGDEFEEWFFEEFHAFSDQDINSNSVDFIYWMNSTGMSEFTLEKSQRDISLPEWRRQEAHRREKPAKVIVKP
jgi:T5orf172 domain